MQKISTIWQRLVYIEKERHLVWFFMWKIRTFYWRSSLYHLSQIISKKWNILFRKWNVIDQIFLNGVEVNMRCPWHHVSFCLVNQCQVYFILASRTEIGFSSLMQQFAPQLHNKCLFAINISWKGSNTNFI